MDERQVGQVHREDINARPSLSLYYVFQVFLTNSACLQLIIAAGYTESESCDFSLTSPRGRFLHVEEGALLINDVWKGYPHSPRSCAPGQDHLTECRHLF